jgi:large subunit ribosomal protein L16
MLMPKRVKWRKQMRGRMRGRASRGAEVTFGDYGLQALEPGWVTARQIEASRRALVRFMRRRGKVWIRPGLILFEVSGLAEEAARDAMRLASHKLAIKTKFAMRQELAAGGGER